VTSESGRIDGTLVGRRNELAGLLAQAAEVRGGRLTQEEVSVAGLAATGRGQPSGGGRASDPGDSRVAIVVSQRCGREGHSAVSQIRSI
jgi:hypothetical protein